MPVPCMPCWNTKDGTDALSGALRFSAASGYAMTLFLCRPPANLEMSEWEIQ